MVEILVDFFEFWKEQEFAYRFVSGLIFLLVTISLLLFFSIMISRSIKNRIEYLEDKYKNKFEEILTSFLFDVHNDRESNEYKKMLSDLKEDFDTSLKRKTFVASLIELHKNLQGESAKSLELLYKDLGLKKFAFKQIKKGRWFTKALAFLEVSQFDVKDAGDMIMKYADHENKILRDEAQFALIRLLGVRGLSFVPKVKTIMSDWQQLRIMEQLKRMHRDEIPSFRPWLKNSNYSVVVFGLKLATYFNQVDAEPDIIALFDHEEEKVKQNALIAIGKLQLEDASPKIMEYYDRFESSKLKITSIETLKELLIDNQKDFFITRLKDDIYKVVMLSAKALAQLGYEKEVIYQSSHLNNFNRRIVIHALDERI